MSTIIATGVGAFLIAITAIAIYIFRYEITGQKHPCLKRYNIEKRTNAGGHMFDPIHNGADECECGLVKSASVHY